MLLPKHVQLLRQKRNLLAFSAGTDSCALFFSLLYKNIPFDIAIVNYGTRQTSNEEVAYAQSLAKRYDKKCYVLQAPPIQKNFEHNARRIRYDFFHTLIRRHGYDTLLTAHQLNDRLEWFFMQLTKGAGCLELAGMQALQHKNGYLLVRPLLHVAREEILRFLQDNAIRYFYDTSNDDETYVRNFFRKRYVDDLVRRFASGLQRSFEYMQEDIEALRTQTRFRRVDTLFIAPSTSSLADMRLVDSHFKRQGIVLSRYDKTSIKRKQTLVVARKYLVTFYKKHILVAPFLQARSPLPKRFKEQCRLAKIEPKLRPYLFYHPNAFSMLLKL